MKNLTMRQKINMCLAKLDKRQAWLARELGQTPANFNLKLKRETLTETDLEKIAGIIGAVYVPASFEFPDGTKI